MSVNSALGVLAARAGARILALVLGAHQTRRTVSIDDTLRPAVGRRADVVGHTLAGSLFAVYTAMCVRTAWRWIAWAPVNFFSCWWRSRETTPEWIASFVRVAAANWTMVEHLAASVCAAGSTTCVNTFSIDARFG